MSHRHRWLLTLPSLKTGGVCAPLESTSTSSRTPLCSDPSALISFARGNRCLGGTRSKHGYFHQRTPTLTLSLSPLSDTRGRSSSPLLFTVYHNKFGFICGDTDISRRNPGLVTDMRSDELTYRFIQCVCAWKKGENEVKKAIWVM